MDEVSIGPEENDDQPVQPGVDAQSETERDIERGLAGAEAKPFSEAEKAKNLDTEGVASEVDKRNSSSVIQDSLISGRRNSGRE
jgi:hypothetical protein